jgi:hypothetical protein
MVVRVGWKSVCHQQAEGVQSETKDQRLWLPANLDLVNGSGSVAYLECSPLPKTGLELKQSYDIWES